MIEVPSYNEKHLLIKVSQGNEQAFRSLYENYHQFVYGVSYRFTRSGSMAEDAVQEIFIKIWVNKEKLSEIENFRAYLHILVRNHALNSLRKLANEEQFIRKLMASENHSDIETSDQAIYNELKKHLNEAVVTLSPQQKKAYNLSRIEGLKYEEIAEQMEISRETVKKHISEALRIIRKHLSEEELPLVFLVLSACTTVTKYL